MTTHDTLPRTLRLAAAALDPAFEIAGFHNVSMTVSTNRVYRLTFTDGSELFAKLSSYGSYVHFREDHQLIHQWSSHLRHTPYEHFLARVALRDGKPFTFRRGDEWSAFYHKVPFYDFLPRRLTLSQVDAFGRELARFHKESARIANYMDGSWKSLGSDVARLYDQLQTPDFRATHHLSEEGADALKEQCDLFLQYAGELGYHRMQRIPVLVDWNTTNFSVGLDRTGFKFFSRWDYDWFRLEPRVLDFYFCARVVRDEGDQTVFSYNADPFFEPRFEHFLRAYHEEYPLTESELLMVREMYRFFLLNYVIRVGDHFFRPEIRHRLLSEAAEQHLPAIESLDFRRLLSVLK